jgi:hypothetical protein
MLLKRVIIALLDMDNDKKAKEKSFYSEKFFIFFLEKKYGE